MKPRRLYRVKTEFNLKALDWLFFYWSLIMLSRNLILGIQGTCRLQNTSIHSPSNIFARTRGQTRHVTEYLLAIIDWWIFECYSPVFKTSKSIWRLWRNSLQLTIKLYCIWLYCMTILFSEARSFPRDSLSNSIRSILEVAFANTSPSKISSC